MVTPSTCAPDTLKLWGFLPPPLQITDEANNYTFLTWLDGIGQQQQIIDNLIRDQGANPGWSIVLDVTRCPTYALPWLAQFVGVRFTGPVLGNDSLMRNAIVAKNGFNRGTPGSIVAAVTPFLDPATGFVNVIENYPDPYSLTVQIFGDLGAMDYAELAKAYPWYTSAGGSPNLSSSFPTYGNFPANNQALVTAIVQAAVPAGLVCTVVFL